jgi:uncharacterized protein YjiS (DUF1127 family)
MNGSLAEVGMWIREGSHRDGVLRRAVPGCVRFLGRTLIGPVARWERRRATIRALSSLDDRMLADIGISRNEIRQVVLGRLPRRRVETVGASMPASASAPGEMRKAA